MNDQVSAVRVHVAARPGLEQTAELATAVSKAALGHPHPRARPGSVLDLRRTLPFQRLESVPHDLQLLRRVTDPVDDLTHDAQRIAAAV